MNKKLNTVLFLLGGTFVNLVLALVSIGLLLFLLGRVEPFLGEQTATFIPFVFLGGILLGMIMYQKLSKWVIRRFNLEDKMNPLFSLRSKKRRD
jgi:hypothetical protein